MKEKDVRQGIEGFLKRTARYIIIPASVGLSLPHMEPSSALTG
jgi:hypothetical protein